MNKLIISKRALKELEKSFNWYEDNQADLGERFLNQFYKKLNIILSYPKRSIIRKAPYREARIDIFPFLIVYRVNEIKKEIFIVSVFHFSRNPKRKYK